MKLFLVPDKFKGALTSRQVREAIALGIGRVLPEAKIKTFAASDGGDGFLDAIASGEGVEPIQCNTLDPLGRSISATFLWDALRRIAYIEMAMASGLELLTLKERNPLYTSTLGTGILIQEAINKGAKRVFIGLGGSATNDGGMGIAAAFGFTFTDIDGNLLEPIGANMVKVSRIHKPPSLPAPDQIELIAVNDVENLLYGPNGAAYVYGPQKGADQSALRELDCGLSQLEQVVFRDLGISAGQLPGVGAAGGAAYGLKVFLNAGFAGGADFVIEYLGLKTAIRDFLPDLIITGEGKIDRQTLCGKFIQGVLKFGAHAGVPVAAVCGRCTLTKEEIKQAGFEWVLEVADSGKPLAWNLEHAFERTVETVSQQFMK